LKIAHVHIDNHKIFRTFDIDFKKALDSPHNLLVLAGINGSGKTTLLNFIYNNVKGNTKLLDKNESNWIQFYDPHLLKGNLTGNDYFTIDSHTQPLISNSVFLYPAAERPNKNITKAIIDYIDSLIYEKNIKAFDAYDELRAFIKNILSDFKLNFVFSKITGQKVPVFKNQLSDNLKLDDLSSGERQIISSVLRLFLEGIKDSVILIDEPEFSLHPSWQNSVVKVYQRYADEYNCQIILATHSPHIIGSVKQEQLRILYTGEGKIKVAEHINGSYGWRVEKVLMEVMGIKHLRTPEVDAEIDKLNEMITSGETETPDFKIKMKNLENILGYEDRDLVLMRFEIAKRKKEK
jgi:predicted ATP-binding protein involved in virulence